MVILFVSPKLIVNYFLPQDHISNDRVKWKFDVTWKHYITHNRNILSLWSIFITANKAWKMYFKNNYCLILTSLTNRNLNYSLWWLMFVVLFNWGIWSVHAAFLHSVVWVKFHELENNNFQMNLRMHLTLVIHPHKLSYIFQSMIPTLFFQRWRLSMFLFFYMKFPLLTTFICSLLLGDHGNKKKIERRIKLMRRTANQELSSWNWFGEKRGRN